MRVGLITFGGDGGKSGISQYIIKLIEQFNILSHDMDFEVIVYEDEKSIFVPEGSKMGTYCYGSSLRNPVVNLGWFQVGLPGLCRKRGYDVLFLPAANRRAPFWVPCPTVGTVHDFSSAHVTEKYDPARMFFIKKVTPILIKRLDMILTVSECSKTDIVNFCDIPDDRVVVTPNGVDLQTYCQGDKSLALETLQAKYPIKSPYILYVSRIEHPGKNHAKLIKAFNKLKSGSSLPHQLVLAGSKWSRAEEVFEVADQSPFKNDIFFTGFVPGTDLPPLFRGADLFVFPSLFEGFGMPILEAMACGTPTVCSNISSMPEVAGDAALLFDPYDENSISDAMFKMLSEKELSEQLVKKGLARSRLFSWENTAMKTLDVISRARMIKN